MTPTVSNANPPRNGRPAQGPFRLHAVFSSEALHIAQPALSRTIRGLEEELNVTLFEKEGRSIRLTRDGHILLKYAERFLADYDGLQQELKDSRDLQ